MNFVFLELVPGVDRLDSILKLRTNPSGNRGTTFILCFFEVIVG